MKRFRHILHASDFSSASRPAFDRALELAKTSRAALTILHVIAPIVPLLGDGYVSPQVIDELDRRGRAYAAREMGKLVSEGQAGRRTRQEPRARRRGRRSDRARRQGPAR